MKYTRFPPPGFIISPAKRHLRACVGRHIQGVQLGAQAANQEGAAIQEGLSVLFGTDIGLDWTF